LLNKLEIWLIRNNQDQQFKQIMEDRNKIKEMLGGLENENKGEQQKE
jgi:hypothetical protein